MEDWRMMELIAQLENDGKWVEATYAAYDWGWIPDEEFEAAMEWARKAEEAI